MQVRELKVYPIDDTWYSVINYKDGTEHGNEIIDTEVSIVAFRHMLVESLLQNCMHHLY